jgi:glycerol-3-phosphate acyltransferase PlsY
MLLITIVLAYLLGSIPFGLFAGKIANIDVLQAGSKNIGFTNVFRLCGWRYGLPTLLLDIGKGFCATYFLPIIFLPGADSLTVVFVGLSALVGNILPIWLKGRGGKGVATATDVYLAILPNELLIALAIFLTFVVITKYVSIGSIMASISLLTNSIAHGDSFSLQQWPITTLTILTFGLIIFTHRQNIKRLFAGTENKFKLKSQKP